jgi:hypothetical protein
MFREHFEQLGRPSRVMLRKPNPAACLQFAVNVGHCVFALG